MEKNEADAMTFFADDVGMRIFQVANELWGTDESLNPDVPIATSLPMPQGSDDDEFRAKN